MRSGPRRNGSDSGKSGVELGGVRKSVPACKAETTLRDVDVSLLLARLSSRRQKISRYVDI